MEIRMIKHNGTTVTQCMVAPASIPYSAEGWIDVSGVLYSGQPVSVGWLYNGGNYIPPPPQPYPPPWVPPPP